MSDSSPARFSCEGCGKSYAWKPELAGRRVKCKCGQVMTVPQAPPGQAAPEDLYDLAPSEESPAAKPTVAHPAPAVAARPAGAAPAPRAAAAVHPASPRSVPLAYGGGLTQRQRASSDALLDMQRDAYVPVALLLIGLALYVGYYAFRYHLSPFGIAMTGVGLSLMTAFKAVLMVGFALAVAGPLGVSFGGIWTAALKLAAIAVFCDGVTTWIDAGVARMSGGVGMGGFMGFGVISFPIALGLYWGLLIYLFSMDPGDSWIVVMLLAVFDCILRTVLMLLLLGLILSWGGVGGTAAASVPTFGGGSSSSTVSPLVEQVEGLKDHNLLEEARGYIASGHQAVFSKATEDWYKAGARNVWFEVSRDINGKTEPQSVIVELPGDKAQRAKCFQVLKNFYDEVKFSYGTDDVTDQGEPYMQVQIE